LFILLHSKWEFHEVIGNPNACIIQFSVEFEFKSVLYAGVANYFFEYVTAKNLEAFTRRIQQVSAINRENLKEETLSLANVLSAASTQTEANNF
jgi:ribosome-associated toxin RatA of RatAB toxin-antitoxin module